jgi:hypothetical protein
MIPYPQTFLVLGTIIVVTFTIHIFDRRVFVASATIGLACGLIFTLVSLVQDHHLSAVPFLMGGLYGFIFALFVGRFFTLAGGF